MFVWPEVTILWGGGATAALGIPTTYVQGEILRILANDELDLGERIGKIEIFRDVKEDLKCLLISLGDGLNSRLCEVGDEEYEAFLSLVRGCGVEEIDRKTLEDRIVALRLNYDWDALKRLISLVPKQDLLMNLFNVIDLHLGLDSGIHVGFDEEEEGNRSFVQTYRLKGARNCLIFLIQLMMSCAYYKLVSENMLNLGPYKKFAAALAKLMLEESCYLGYMFPPDDRRFYLLSYAVISMNYEPLLLWLLYEAYKKVGIDFGSSVPLILAHDLGTVVSFDYRGEEALGDQRKCRHVLHEIVAQNVNDQGYGVVRVGRFYLPHGNCILRACPSCGKAFIVMGGESRLFPVNIIPRLRKLPPVGDEREKVYRNYKFDVLACPYCGTFTETQSSVMVMQTSFKDKTFPLLSEIQKEVRLCFENVKHLVLLGYSFPVDDLVWSVALRSKKHFIDKKQALCSIVVGFKGEKRWLFKEELQNYVDFHSKDIDQEDYGVPVIKRMIDIFGIDNVRAFCGGIPDVWMYGEDVRNNVLNILYPEDPDFYVGFPVERR